MRRTIVIAALLFFAPSPSYARLVPADWMEWQGSKDPSVDPLNWNTDQASFREIVWHAQNDTIKQAKFASLKRSWAQSHVQVRALMRCEAVDNYQGTIFTDCFLAPDGDPAPKATLKSSQPWVSYWAFVKTYVLPKVRSTNTSPAAMPLWPVNDGPRFPGQPAVTAVQRDQNNFNSSYIDFFWTFTLDWGPVRRPPPRRGPGISSNSDSNQARCDELQREINYSRSRSGGQQDVVAVSEEMRRLGCPGYGTQQPDIAQNPAPSKGDCLALQNAYSQSEIAPASSGLGKVLQQMSRTTGMQVRECWQKYWASRGAGPSGGPPSGLYCGYGLNC